MRLNPARRPLLPRLLLGLVALFALIQLVPYGRAHSNPPVAATPQWSDPDTKALFTRACADCHGNATVWPWYSNVAPVSWLLERHVTEGRGRFNINAAGFGRKADEAAKVVRNGSMPDRSYLIMHPEARLTDTERQQLADGLQMTFGGDSGGDGGGDGGGN